MKSKRDIEQMLDHMRAECSQKDTEANRIWIQALEWVLGNEAQQAAHAEYIRSLEAFGQANIMDGIGDRATKLALTMALDRLR